MKNSQVKEGSPSAPSSKADFFGVIGDAVTAKIQKEEVSIASVKLTGVANIIYVLLGFFGFKLAQKRWCMDGYDSSLAARIIYVFLGNIIEREAVFFSNRMVSIVYTIIFDLDDDALSPEAVELLSNSKDKIEMLSYAVRKNMLAWLSTVISMVILGDLIISTIVNIVFKMFQL